MQAPQLLVSHPTFVPVSPRVSRRKYTRSVRGSTSASRIAPLTVTETCVTGSSFSRRWGALVSGGARRRSVDPGLRTVESGEPAIGPGRTSDRGARCTTDDVPDLDRAVALGADPEAGPARPEHRGRPGVPIRRDGDDLRHRGRVRPRRCSRVAARSAAPGPRRGSSRAGRTPPWRPRARSAWPPRHHRRCPTRSAVPSICPTAHRGHDLVRAASEALALARHDPSGEERDRRARGARPPRPP